jgi:hypothetical protein
VPWGDVDTPPRRLRRAPGNLKTARRAVATSSRNSGSTVYNAAVSRWFGGGFYVGLSIALSIALFLLWLWRPERQVRYHSEHLLRAIEHKSWSAVADFVAADYHDQWGNDRARLLERMREVLRYLRGLRVEPSNVTINIDNGRGTWIANIKIDGQPDELMVAAKEQVNSLPTPFELEWRHVSNKPWDWKLVSVSNSGLQLPAEFD